MLARRYFTFKQQDSIAEDDLSKTILRITAIKKEQKELKQLQKKYMNQLLQELQDDTMPTLLPPIAPITVDVGGPLSTVYESDDENDS
jgi:hypothetical protein